MPDQADGGWFLGIDVGTGSSKSVAIDAGGQVLGLGARAYPAGDPDRRWKEQDPQDLVMAAVHSARAAIDQAGVSPGNCRGISLGGIFHSLMAVDRAGQPITGVSTWVDDRATAQAQAVRKGPNRERLYQRTGCPVHSMYPLYKIAWLRENQPDTFKQAGRFISAKEYVLARLTGEWLVDFGIAGGSGLLNAHTLDWEPLALEVAGIQPAQLSPLCSPRRVIDQLDPEMASQMGIPASTPLVVGSADAVNSSLGAGAVLASQATCMVGTSGAFRIIAGRPMLDPQARSWCYAIDSGYWLVGGAINNGGLALSWFREALGSHAVGKPLTFPDLITLAGQVEAGAQGLLCLPFFAGERSPHWNMNARGVFFGLSLHHDIRHLTRALLEGVAFRLRSVRDVLVELGAEVDQVLASGGFTRSDLWPQIVASVLGHDLLVPESGETSSLGAAFWALLGTGGIDRLEDLSQWVPVARRYKPDSGTAQLYDQLFRLYLDLYAQMEAGFERLANLTRPPGDRL